MEAYFCLMGDLLIGLRIVRRLWVSCLGSSFAIDDFLSSKQTELRGKMWKEIKNNLAGSPESLDFTDSPKFLILEAHS